MEIIKYFNRALSGKDLQKLRKYGKNNWTAPMPAHWIA
jgi:hypothetical protein